tara:strand:- start:3401 stop:4270 length:870 start_codon:yes stop_codon:yes gene_type:complete
MSYRLRLDNPSDEVHHFTFEKGNKLGRNNSGVLIRCKESVVYSVPPATIREIYFDNYGRPLTPMTLDDRRGEEVKQFDVARDVNAKIRLSNEILHKNKLEQIESFRNGVLNLVNSSWLERGNGTGGVNLLSSYSRERSKRDGVPAIYSPKCLGIELDKGDLALHGLLASGNLDFISAIGKGHDQVNSLQIELRNNSTESVSFVIPSGLMFEQENQYSNSQHLIARDEIEVTINPSSTKIIGVHGMCGNKNLSSPDGDRMLITPFIFSSMNEIGCSSQGDVWKRTGGNQS